MLLARSRHSSLDRNGRHQANVACTRQHRSQQMTQDDRPPHPPRGPPPGATEPPEHVRKPQIYEIFHGSRPQDRDGTMATAVEGQQEQQPHHRPTVTEAVKTIEAKDFLHVHQTPCAREGFMTGIAAGLVIGAGRYITGARVPKASNWAFGSFILGSIVQYEYCQYQRAKERAALARVVEVLDRKAAEKQEKEKAAANAARKKAEEANASKSWYNFWS